MGKTKSFRERVFAVVSHIPKGKTLTYKQVAQKAGAPGASRAVGNILAKNSDLKHVPCHRVIRSDGSVGGYFGDSKKSGLKRAKLLKEGALRA